MWRLSFNSPATGILRVLEDLIDIYFAVDVILNMHTAWYDESGDLQGVKSGGERNGTPDYKGLYLNYVRNTSNPPRYLGLV